MNVLVLTPDAVGSTLLQRLITIYMQFHEFDKPVINIHELAQGLSKYYSPDFNRELLSGNNGNALPFQSLTEITNLLRSTDHYKTSRLAQYHIRTRRDPIEEQIPFYRYLNENFYIISSRRHNVFEQALSWAINKITKKLNVYTAQENFDTFLDLFKDPVTVDPNSLIFTLETYKNYIQWCDDHFDVGSYFYYDQHLGNIEKFILNLPIFTGQPKKLSWEDVYGISFNSWNQCHRITSNIEEIALSSPEQLKQLSWDTSVGNNLDHLDQLYQKQIVNEYKLVADSSWPTVNTVEDFQNLPEAIKDECIRIHGLQAFNRYNQNKKLVSFLPADQVAFANKNMGQYLQSLDSIEQMHKLGILFGGVPIKKQTLAGKRAIVKNFDECVNVYNEWIIANPEIGKPIDSETIKQEIDREREIWSVSKSDQSGQHLLN